MATAAMRASMPMLVLACFFLFGNAANLSEEAIKHVNATEAALSQIEAVRKTADDRFGNASNAGDEIDGAAKRTEAIRSQLSKLTDAFWEAVDEANTKAHRALNVSDPTEAASALNKSQEAQARARKQDSAVEALFHEWRHNLSDDLDSVRDQAKEDAKALKEDVSKLQSRARDAMNWLYSMGDEANEKADDLNDRITDVGESISDHVEVVAGHYLKEMKKKAKAVEKDVKKLGKGTHKDMKEASKDLKKLLKKVSKDIKKEGSDEGEQKDDKTSDGRSSSNGASSEGENTGDKTSGSGSKSASSESSEGATTVLASQTSEAAGLGFALAVGLAAGIVPALWRRRRSVDAGCEPLLVAA